MGRNVFVSYKYRDNSVKQFDKEEETICRDYVDVIEKRILRETDSYYYRGEEDGNDNSHLDYKVVEAILSDLIFHTSVTVVLISPKMFDHISEYDQ